MIPQKYLEIVLHLLPLVLPMVIYFLFRFVLLSASLFFMLRVQSLNYNIPGLLGSAALASACDMIPFGGHALAVGVLLFCVIKLTGAHFIDVRFTVSISYAIMFLVQMLLLSAMPFQVGTHARTQKTPFRSLLHMQDKQDDSDDVSMTAAASTNEFPSTNQLAATSARTNALASASTNSPVASTNGVAATASVAPANDKAKVEQLAKNFTLKGMVPNGRDTLVMVGAGSKTYTLALGERTAVDTKDGLMEVSLDQVTPQGAVLKVNGTMVPLRLR